jgi:hypothetical protein
MHVKSPEFYFFKRQAISLNSRQKLKKALELATSSTLLTVRVRWGWVLGAAALSVVGKLHFAQYTTTHLPEHEYLRLIGQLGEASVDLCASVLALFLGPITTIDAEQKRPWSSIWKHSNEHLYGLTVESLRAMTQILLWAILLILPGVYRSLCLSFFPFVVMFDERYSKGEIDALKTARENIRGVLWAVVLIGVVSLVLDLTIKASLGMAPPGLPEYLARFAISLLTLVLSIYTLLASFHLYRLQKAPQA